MDKKTTRKNYIIALAFSIVLIILDQVTKYLAVIHLKNSEGIDIVPNVFKLHYLENRGAAFGIMQGRQGFFFIMTVIVLVAIIYVYGKIPVEKHFMLMRICSILLFSGAIGNMIDRSIQNYVVDFLYFELIDFPIFNVADIYVTISTIIFIISILFYYKESDLEQIKLLPNKKK